MKLEYKFFEDFIITELDWEIEEQKVAYKILKSFDAMYTISKHIPLFVELKELIETSKRLHGEIKLFMVPNRSLATGCHWRLADKSIAIELPNLESSDKNMDYCFLFNGFIWELCNSINKYFSIISNSLSLDDVAGDNRDLSAFLTELAEYESARASHLKVTLLIEDITKFLKTSKETQDLYLKEYNGNEQFIINYMELLSRYTMLPIAVSFVEYWEYVNLEESSSNRGYSHAEHYRKEVDPDQCNLILNKIYQIIVKQLKQGVFSLKLSQKQYHDLLTTIAKQFPIKKAEYFSIYEIIMNDGKTLEQIVTIELDEYFKKLTFCFYCLSNIVVGVAQGKLCLQKTGGGDKEFIELVFDILDEFQKEDMSDKAQIFLIVTKFIKKLQQITLHKNSEFIQQYQDMLENFNNIISNKHMVQELTPEVTGLVKNAIKELLQAKELYNKEHILIAFKQQGKIKTINVVGGILNTDKDNTVFVYNSPKRICCLAN